MQANELRIGNWVIDTKLNLIMQITASALFNMVHYRLEFDPIPLTPEILEQCGFEISVGNSTSNYKYYASNGFVDVKFWNDTTTVYMCIGGVKCPLTHITGLHQLQNFIYFTFNTELQWNRKQ